MSCEFWKNSVELNFSKSCFLYIFQFSKLFINKLFLAFLRPTCFLQFFLYAQSSDKLIIKIYINNLDNIYKFIAINIFHIKNSPANFPPITLFDREHSLGVSRRSFTPFKLLNIGNFRRILRPSETLYSYAIFYT